VLLEQMGKVPKGSADPLQGESSVVPAAGKLFERSFTTCGRTLIIQQDFAGDVAKSEVWRAGIAVMEYVQNTHVFGPGFVLPLPHF